MNNPPSPKATQPASTPSSTSASPLLRTQSRCKNCHSIEECAYPSHRGYTYQTTNRGTNLAACPHLESWKAKRRLENQQEASSLPKQYRNLTFKDLHRHSGNVKAILAATSLTSLYISGGTNTGKTLLLSVIGNEQLRRGKEVKYTTAAEMQLELRYNREDCETRLKTYQGVDVLLIDDLGLERPSDYGAEQLYMVLEGRNRQGNITVIASPHTLTELQDRYPEGTYNKLKQLTEREETLTITEGNNR